MRKAGAQEKKGNPILSHFEEFGINEPIDKNGMRWINLYLDLKGKLSADNPGYPNDDLDVLIHKHANFSDVLLIAEQGGSHDLLFFLKSLDLDLRFGYDLGTVFGYKDAP